jgi:regulator of protease activity HflC (stomatin/prohibitin superfamily)
VRFRAISSVNLSASFVVTDPKRLATVARAPDDVVYLAMQLAAREAVATRTLDELLADRDAVAKSVQSEVASKAEAVGLTLTGFGIKDVILPGEMKALLNRVIEAQKEAEANVILRREETAATRSMAQTAKVLAENPLLIRLKELEAYKDLASKVGQVHLVLGEGAVPTLQLKSGS